MISDYLLILTVNILPKAPFFNNHIKNIINNSTAIQPAIDANIDAPRAIIVLKIPKIKKKAANNDSATIAKKPNKNDKTKNNITMPKIITTILNKKFTTFQKFSILLSYPYLKFYLPQLFFESNFYQDR